MPDAAIVILAGTDRPSDLGRVVNALQTATEFVEEGDDAEVIFDGAGTQWIPELEDQDHEYHELYADLTDRVQACDYCSQAYDVAEEIEESEADNRDEFDGHPSLHSLVSDGYEIITY